MHVLKKVDSSQLSSTFPANPSPEWVTQFSPAQSSNQLYFQYPFLQLPFLARYYTRGESSLRSRCFLRVPYFALFRRDRLYAKNVKQTYLGDFMMSISTFCGLNIGGGGGWQHVSYHFARKVRGLKTGIRVLIGVGLRGRWKARAGVAARGKVSRNRMTSLSLFQAVSDCC